MTQERCVSPGCHRPRNGRKGNSQKEDGLLSLSSERGCLRSGPTINVSQPGAVRAL